jgi:hypothetical protein
MTACTGLRLSCESRWKVQKTRLSRNKRSSHDTVRGAAKANDGAVMGGSALKELGLVPWLELNLRPVCPKIHMAGGRSHRRTWPELGSPCQKERQPPP